MRGSIGSTQLYWKASPNRVVLLRRINIKILWYIGLAFGVKLAAAGLMHWAQMLAKDGKAPWLVWGILFSLMALGVVLAYLFLRLIQAKHRQVLCPVRWLRRGAGVQLALESRQIPIATGMGGTAPGPKTRWLVIDQSGKRRRWVCFGPRTLAQVHREVDLVAINLALAHRGSGVDDTPLTPEPAR